MFYYSTSAYKAKVTPNVDSLEVPIQTVFSSEDYSLQKYHVVCRTDGDVEKYRDGVPIAMFVLYDYLPYCAEVIRQCTYFCKQYEHFTYQVKYIKIMHII